MAFSFFSAGRSPSASWPAVNHLLVYIRFLSPIILIVVFLVAFTVHSIATASNNAVPTEVTGPGGKPLPQKPSAATRARRAELAEDVSPARKLLFVWLSVGTIVTFVGNAVLVIVHTVLARQENWWCGESVAVWFGLGPRACASS
jgi:hypothetical protein